MRTTNNRGNEEWLALRAPHEIGRGKQRSLESAEFEIQLRRLLNGYSESDISGCWIDWRKPTREPVFVPAPGAPDDAA
jgi:hypothetical protein